MTNEMNGDEKCVNYYGSSFSKKKENGELKEGFKRENDLIDFAY